MPGPTCASCIYLRKTKGTSALACVRYPVSQPVPPKHWCGEHTKKGGK